MRVESAYANMKNAILSSQARLAPIRPVAATGPLRPQPVYQGQLNRKVVAWGSGSFGNRKGSPPMLSKGLAKYVTRFCHVIKVPEFRTSITRPCDTRTHQYEIRRGIIFEHIKRNQYEDRPPGKRWHKRSKWCCFRLRLINAMDINFAYIDHYFQKGRGRLRVPTPIPRLSGPSSEREYDNGSLQNKAVPWTVYLANKCHGRQDHKAVWHKVVMAAFNMRRIVQRYDQTGARPARNFPNNHGVF